MTAAILPAAHSRYRALVLFAFLQLLDFMTTMAVFARGGFEMNPVVRQFIPLFGPVGGVLASKVLITWLVWRFSRRLWLLYAGNTMCALVVGWNMLMIFISQ